MNSSNWTGDISGAMCKMLLLRVLSADVTKTSILSHSDVFSFNSPEEREWAIQQKHDANATEAEYHCLTVWYYITCNYYKI